MAATLCGGTLAGKRSCQPSRIAQRGHFPCLFVFPPRCPGGPTSPTGGAASTTSSAPAVETRPPAGPERCPPPPAAQNGPLQQRQPRSPPSPARMHGPRMAQTFARAPPRRAWQGQRPPAARDPRRTQADAARARAATARDRAGAMDYEFVNWGDRKRCSTRYPV